MTPAQLLSYGLYFFAALGLLVSIVYVLDVSTDLRARFYKRPKKAGEYSASGGEPPWYVSFTQEGWERRRIRGPLAGPTDHRF